MKEEGVLSAIKATCENGPESLLQKLFAAKLQRKKKGERDREVANKQKKKKRGGGEGRKEEMKRKGNYSKA